MSKKAVRSGASLIAPRPINEEARHVFVERQPAACRGIIIHVMAYMASIKKLCSTVASISIKIGTWHGDVVHFCKAYYQCISAGTVTAWPNQRYRPFNIVIIVAAAQSVPAAKVTCAGAGFVRSGRGIRAADRRPNGAAREM